ncbi:hypothetical protein Leryth_005670 [Lithospermum erythrorhizon]|nr:hypothetical protein Leryth_005670 [Lithospermum erythrorhizon]
MTSHTTTSATADATTAADHTTSTTADITITSATAADVTTASADVPAATAEDFVHVERTTAVKSDDSNSSDSSDESKSVINEEPLLDDNINYEENNLNNIIENYDDISTINQRYVRKELPEEMAKQVVTLTCESTVEGGVCDVYLVGTAHVSRESCDEVQALISFLQPQVVFLELCASRVTVLSPQNIKVPTMGEMVEMWKRKQNLFGILYSWFLAKVASKLEVFPGAEFRMAYEEAIKYGGKVILGDRPVQITLRRTWGKMPLWHKTKLVSSLLFQAVSLPSPESLTKMLKEMDDVDVITLVIQEMSKQYPTLMETLVHERDKLVTSNFYTFLNTVFIDQNIDR